MKRSKMLTISVLAILMLALTALSGCLSLSVASVTVIEQPKTTFVQDANWTMENSGLSFSLAVERDGQASIYVYGRTPVEGENTLSYNGGEGLSFTIDGFSLAETGNFTATITVLNSTVKFDYTVVGAGSAAAGFAGGSGVEGDPYLITDATQLANLEANTGKYETGMTYVQLANDIDMTGTELKEGKKYGDGFILEMKNVVLDGNGHKLYNFNWAADSALAEYFDGTVIVKDVDFYLGGSFSLFHTSSGYTTVDNVRMYGNVYGNTQYRGLFGYRAQGKTVYQDCENYANIDSTALYMAAFVGYTSSTTGDLQFINCTNYGIVSGIDVAVYVANASAVNSSAKIAFNNCQNRGEVIAIGKANTFFAVGLDDASVANNKNLTINNTAFNTNKKVLAAGEYFTATANANEKVSVQFLSDEVARVIVRPYYDVIKYLGVEENKGDEEQCFEETLTASGTCQYAGKYAVTPVETKTVENVAVNGMAYWALNAEGKYELPKMYAFNDEYKITIEKEKTVAIAIFAYDAEGNMIAGAIK